MPQAKLSPKQEAFVTNYVTNGFNATKAAIKAGYSPNNATPQAARLLTKANVKEAVERKQNLLQVQVEYSHADWLRDVQVTVAEAREAKSYSAALKGYELLGRHIGALTSDRRLSRDEAELFSYLGAEMQKLQTAKENAKAEVRELPPSGKQQEAGE